MQIDKIVVIGKRNAAFISQLIEGLKSQVIAKEDGKNPTSESCSSNKKLKQKVTVVACFKRSILISFHHLIRRLKRRSNRKNQVQSSASAIASNPKSSGCPSNMRSNSRILNKSQSSWVMPPFSCRRGTVSLSPRL